MCTSKTKRQFLHACGTTFDKWIEVDRAHRERSVVSGLIGLWIGSQRPKYLDSPVIILSVAPI
jgi:hypothetical protein